MSGNKGGQKRKKASYYSASKKPRLKHSLQPGLKGFLITCNKREREAVTEAYKLLAEYADKMLGPEEDDAELAKSSEDEDDDLEAALQKEVAALKAKKNTERRFQQVECGANNVLFIKTTVTDPTSLLHAILEDLYETGCSKSRHIMRILPVIGTCRASEESIEKAAPDLLKPVFAQSAPSHCLQFKIRNNNSVSRTSLLPVFGGLISNLCPESKVDFDAPDLVVSVDVVKTMCCISAVRDFHKFRKYNLQELATLAQSRQRQKTKESEEDAVACDHPPSISETQAVDVSKEPTISQPTIGETESVIDAS